MATVGVKGLTGAWFTASIQVVPLSTPSTQRTRPEMNLAMDWAASGLQMAIPLPVGNCALLGSRYRSRCSSKAESTSQ